MYPAGGGEDPSSKRGSGMLIAHLNYVGGVSQVDQIKKHGHFGFKHRDEVYDTPHHTTPHHTTPQQG